MNNLTIFKKEWLHAKVKTFGNRNDGQRGSCIFIGRTGKKSNARPNGSKKPWYLQRNLPKKEERTREVHVRRI